MSFLYPVFLAGALAIALPIVLHLLRRDVAPEVPFTAVRLLRRTPVEQTRRRRLRDLLLLAARVTALALLAAAFARPYLTGPDAASPLRIVAIDRSFSMGAPRQFERALDEARKAIDEAGRRERIAVIAFDDRAEVVAEPGSAAEARTALGGLRAGYGGTRYAALLRRAAELAEQQPATLIVVTDLQRAGWEGEEPVALPAELAVETREVGRPSANAAVAGVRRNGRSMIASIRNSGSEALEGSVRAAMDGRPVAASRFSAPSGTVVEVPLDFTLPDRGVMSIEIDDPQGYPADNSRYVSLEAEQKTRVLIVGDGPQSGFYLVRALQAAEDEDAFDLRQRPARALGTASAEELSSARVIALLSTRSLDRRAREVLASFVREGGGLLVAASGSVEAGVLASVMQWPGFSAAERETGSSVLAATDVRHPIFRPFGSLAANLSQVQFTRAWLVRGDGWDVAARFTDGSPALLERREGRGRVIVFASDLDRQWNNFPLHPAFVPFTVETVRYLAGPAGERREYLVSDAPSGVPPQPGAHARQPDGRQVIVNVDPRESAAASMSPDEFSGMIEKTDRPASAALQRRAQQAEGRQNLWRYGLMLMLAALVAESVVGRRP